VCVHPSSRFPTNPFNGSWELVLVHGSGEWFVVRHPSVAP
jgi:hypothetical protein